MVQPWPLFVYFPSFRTNNTIFTTNQCAKTMASFRLFSVVSNKQYNFYNKSMCKNVICIQYSAPGFKPTTSQT